MNQFQKNQLLQEAYYEQSIQIKNEIPYEYFVEKAKVFGSAEELFKWIYHNRCTDEQKKQLLIALFEIETKEFDEVLYVRNIFELRLAKKKNVMKCKDGYVYFDSKPLC